MSGFGLIVGLSALAAGAGHIIGRDLPVVPILLIGLGLGLVLRSSLAKDRPAGTPDAS